MDSQHTRDSKTPLPPISSPENSVQRPPSALNNRRALPPIGTVVTKDTSKTNDNGNVDKPESPVGNIQEESKIDVDNTSYKIERNGISTSPIEDVDAERNSAPADDRESATSPQGITFKPKQPLQTVSEIDNTTKINVKPGGRLKKRKKGRPQLRHAVSSQYRAGDDELDPVISSIYHGTCPLNDLPPLNKKTVRIFVSSTFSDTKEERNALMKNVYPKLADVCRQKHGLEFQVVDMRWGVPEQAAENHSTVDICVQEIRKCQDVSVGPCFVTIIGNKYGFRPIPTEITEDLFIRLNEIALSEKSDGSSCDWDLVQRWYLKDENAEPTVFVLQPLSKMFPNLHSTNKEKQKESWELWNKDCQMLTSSLRHISQLAFQQNKITETEKHTFYMSVTESEIEQGIKKSPSKPEETSACILRNINDISEFTDKVIAEKFIDLQSDKVTIDQEAQTLLLRLKNKIPTTLPKANISEVTIDWSASGANVSADSAQDHPHEVLAKHQKYLDQFCNDFLDKMNRLIEQGSIVNSKMYSEMTAEILHHLHIAKGRCEVFEGREDIVNMARTYVSSTSSLPFIVHGKSGCGKTSVLAKICETLINSINTMASTVKPIIIVRFLGTTPETSNLYLLIVSLCKQISKITKIAWSEPSKFTDLVKSLHILLENASKRTPIYLVLDSIDQLIPAYNAYKMTWLPETLPPSCKLIISSIEEGYPIVTALHKRYTDAQFIEVTQLGETLGHAVVTKWLSLKRRRINEDQTDIVKHALVRCSLPLYVRIMYDQIKKWKSYDTVTSAMIETTVKGAINQMFSSMELKFGQALLQHSLAYLTAARHGLSEVELEHLLSLDDVLLNKIYKFWKPPVRRIPPLLWTRVRAEFSSYIVERAADDITVLSWYHRQFIEATKERYLSDIEFAQNIHTNMADFFMGKWGGGKAKPFQYTDHQKKRFKLRDTHGLEDRKVPLQPYIIEIDKAGETELRFNKRKLFELPYHLAVLKQYDSMKKEVFFNFEWMFALLKCSSAMSVLDEFKIFMASEKMLRRDADMKILFANLRMIRPYINTYPNTLSYELSGRLAKYISSSPIIRSLIEQCDNIGSRYFPLTPILTCFPTATVGLQQNINYRASESPFRHSGAFICTTDFKTMYIIDHNDLGAIHLSSWDIESGELMSNIPVVWHGKKVSRILYVQVILDKSEEHLVAFNRGRDLASYHRGRKYDRHDGEDIGYGDGNVDIIQISDGIVLQTYSESFQVGSFFNPVMYCTEHWIAVRMGNKTPLYQLHTEKCKRLNKPHILSKDESLFILSNSDGTMLRRFVGKQLLGEFDPPDALLALQISDDNNIVVFAGPELGELRVYNLSKKMLNTEKLYGYILKTKFIFKLPQHQDTLAKIVTSEYSTRNCVLCHIVLSTNLEYAMVIYQGPQLWLPLLYAIYKGKRISSFVGVIGQPSPKSTRYPAFSYDNSHIVVAKNCVDTKKVVQIFSTSTGQKVQEFYIEQSIKDFYVSKVSDQIAVMTGKDVAFFSIGNPQEDTKATKKKVKAKRKPTKEIHDQTLLKRKVTNNAIHNELVMIQSGVDTIIEEVEGAAHVMDTDIIASARSIRKLALDTHYTPDGLKVVQLHSRLQVVDSVEEDIAYTPVSGDCISRTSYLDNGQLSTEVITIDRRQHEIIGLQLSDKIVNDGGKVKYRVNFAGRDQIMNVPSVLSVYSAASGTPQRLQRSTIFQETIAAVSNKYIVTRKQRQTGNYVKVYTLEEGNLLATHAVVGGFGAVVVPLNEALIILVDQQLTVKAYQAPLFKSCELSIQTRYVEKGKYVNVVWAKCCMSPDQLDEGGNRIVIHWRSAKTVVDNYYYLLVNLVTKTIGKPFNVKTAFEDISVDGEFAIDSHLCVYSLTTGARRFQIPYANEDEKIILRIKISDDLQHVVFIDKTNDSLHVVKLEEKGAVHMASCFTHAPNIDIFNGLTIRNDGNVIAIRSEDAALILLKLHKSDNGNTEKEQSKYDSEMDRAISIVKSSTL